MSSSTTSILKAQKRPMAQASSQQSFHFTPTRASWLNQVEIGFSILQGQSLSGASFTSVKQLRHHIDDFIEAYNANVKPFVWTNRGPWLLLFRGFAVEMLVVLLGIPTRAMNDAVTVVWRSIERVKFQWCRARIDNVMLGASRNEHSEACADRVADAVEDRLA